MLAQLTISPPSLRAVDSRRKLGLFGGRSRTITFSSEEEDKEFSQPFQEQDVDEAP
ncbi:MAG: hypothetical protein KDN22_12060 [Verrucomicrobiae bacterium]|nr:hypothetical protein [Verrucomicrobiae bacterium]